MTDTYYREHFVPVGVATPLEGLARRTAVLDILRSQRHEFALFGVRRLAVFGSTIRGDATRDSDLDLLVEFVGAPTADQFFGLQFLAERLTGIAVDLVTARALRPRLRPFVEREAVDV